MHIGFTGCREGMTEEQIAQVKQLLMEHLHHESAIVRNWFHHGLCRGADFEAHGLAKDAGWLICGHPPKDQRSMVAVECDIMRLAKGYIARNHDIVDDTTRLIACPESHIEELRSGTWATVRYAKQQGKPVELVLPSGRVVMYG